MADLTLGDKEPATKGNGRSGKKNEVVSSITSGRQVISLKLPTFIAGESRGSCCEFCIRAKSDFGLK